VVLVVELTATFEPLAFTIAIEATERVAAQKTWKNLRKCLFIKPPNEMKK